MQTPEPGGISFMREALKLARRGLGRVSPNPMVGAVIVKEGRIIGRGYHRYFGGNHAEVEALRQATEDVAGATMYVTLEPCVHYGKTPPCVDAIIAGRIGRVVIGMLDPDKRVNGRGLETLKKAGIVVQAGLLEAECRALNEAYIKHRRTGLPFVTLKWAQTLDGQIATTTGDSRWISSPASHRLVHRLRSWHDAVLVGAGTVWADNPELTVRMVRGRNPRRVILDSTLKIPLPAGVLDVEKAATLVATTPAADPEKAASLQARGVEVIKLPPDSNGWVDLPSLLRYLGARDITSVLVEGGAATITSFLSCGLVDKFIIFIAPKLLGRGQPAVGDLGIKEIDRSLKLNFNRVYRSGEDIVIEGRPTSGPPSPRQ